MSTSTFGFFFFLLVINCTITQVHSFSRFGQEMPIDNHHTKNILVKETNLRRTTATVTSTTKKIIRKDFRVFGLAENNFGALKANLDAQKLGDWTSGTYSRHIFYCSNPNGKIAKCTKANVGTAVEYYTADRTVECMLLEQDVITNVTTLWMSGKVTYYLLNETIAYNTLSGPNLEAALEVETQFREAVKYGHMIFSKKLTDADNDGLFEAATSEYFTTDIKLPNPIKTVNTTILYRPNSIFKEQIEVAKKHEKPLAQTACLAREKFGIYAKYEPIDNNLIQWRNASAMPIGKIIKDTAENMYNPPKAAIQRDFFDTTLVVDGGINRDHFFGYEIIN